MNQMGLNEIRKSFLDFFASKGHLIMPSFSLIPKNDKSLLLINAGMAPLKPYFTGQEIPPNKRVATCQKCIRTGDIERVGKTARHGTFFEMLGNFSFGDYFKGEIIPWAWEYVTEVLKLPPDKLWVTIYKDDDEAFEIWNRKVGLSSERIVRMGKEDNFWEIGQGPCGPSSEIYFDRGEDKGCGSPDCKVGCDCDRFVEFWNLVFTQFDKDENGNYNRLPNPNIDTGMGLERIATIMQGVDTIFNVDTIKAILDQVCNIAGIHYGKDAKADSSVRLITDHIRSVTFMVSDGILPSNEGRGYVLRRLLRRAARHGKLLGIDGAFLNTLCDVVIENSKDAYPELHEKSEYIKKVIKLEEERFTETIDQGIGILNSYINDMKSDGIKTLSGEKTFKLYDTYGFPFELTMEILDEHGMNIDIDGFNTEMKAQKERARAARETTNYMGSDSDVFTTLPPDINTVFTGYDTTVSEGKVLFIIHEDSVVESVDEGSEAAVILDTTPFYAEMGGQVGDTGFLSADSFKMEITGCKKTSTGKIIHIGKVICGTLHVSDMVNAAVNNHRRMDIARNHTATHLLHAALRKVLGTHVQQSGSLVEPERLRFDFTHFEPISSEDLREIERLANEEIMNSLEVSTTEKSLDEARSMGATALFGEKYGSIVRVVKIGDFSMELCGGTHVKNTSSIGMLKIISESGIASGIRRIEAVTGNGALNYVEGLESSLNNISSLLKTSSKDVLKRIETLMQDVKNRQKEIDELKQKIAGNLSENIKNDAKDIKGVKVVTALVDLDINGMRNLGDRLRDSMKKSVVVLASNKDNKLLFLSMASKDAILQGVHAGNLVREVAKAAGGSGGGKPDMAQAGGKDISKAQEALNTTYQVLEKMIK